MTNGYEITFIHSLTHLLNEIKLLPLLILNKLTKKNYPYPPYRIRYESDKWVKKYHWHPYLILIKEKCMRYTSSTTLLNCNWLIITIKTVIFIVHERKKLSNKNGRNQILSFWEIFARNFVFCIMQKCLQFLLLNFSLKFQNLIGRRPLLFINWCRTLLCAYGLYMSLLHQLIHHRFGDLIMFWYFVYSNCCQLCYDPILKIYIYIYKPVVDIC
jgi:hypothetical protein